MVNTASQKVNMNIYIVVVALFPELMFPYSQNINNLSVYLP